MLVDMRYDFSLVADVVAGRIAPPVPTEVEDTVGPAAEAAPDPEQMGLF